MNIHAYFENLGKKDDESLSTLWRDTWAKDFPDANVTLLGPDDAKQHPLYEAVKSKAASLPTVNNRAYEAACFTRWCAAAMQPEPIVFMDYDVFPLQHHQVLDAIFNLSHGSCWALAIPQCVIGEKEHWEAILKLFLNYDVLDEIHVSDMTILREQHSRFHAVLDLCQDYGSRGWSDKPLVHFGNCYVPDPFSRTAFIESVLKA